LYLQLALLRAEPGFGRLCDRVKEIAGLLSEKAAIPMVREHMALIEDVQTDEWWQDVTVPMLEAFLHEHLSHVVIAKLRMNKPLTLSDLGELERMLAESGIGGSDDIRRAAERSRGLGLFVRSLVGMDRGTAKEAMAGFIDSRTLSANQLEFINLIVDHLTEHGVMEPARLCESPFTDLTAQGPDGLFRPAELDACASARLRALGGAGGISCQRHQALPRSLGEVNPRIGSDDPLTLRG